MLRLHLIPLTAGVFLCLIFASCKHNVNLRDRIVAADTSKYCLPDACFNPHVLAVESQLPSARQTTLQTSMPLSRTSLLLKRFAAPWVFRFRLYRVVENQALAPNRNCPQANVK
jgi:hypothetical protein